MTDWITDFSREITAAQTPTDVYQAAVDWGTTSFDSDACLFAVPNNGVLRVTASTAHEDDVPQTFDITTSLPGCIYSSGQPSVFEDITDVRSARANSSASSLPTDPTASKAYRSMLGAPIEGVGVLIALARASDAFTLTDRDRAQTMAAVVAGALEGIQREPHRNQLEEIASILAHDVKGPLSVARGRIELANTPTSSDHLADALDALDRLEALIDDIVMLARTNDRIGTQVPVAMDQVVKKAWATVSARPATLEIEDSKRILADESTTCQLFENLLSNAVEHGGPDVTIRVGVLPGGFYVEDDGPGIPAEHRDTALQWGVSFESGHGGYGLGIVSRIADAHDWNITITSSHTGGARFEITNVESA